MFQEPRCSKSRRKRNDFTSSEKKPQNKFIQTEIRLVQTTVVMKCSQIKVQNMSERLHSKNESILHLNSILNTSYILKTTPHVLFE